MWRPRACRLLPRLRIRPRLLLAADGIGRRRLVLWERQRLGAGGPRRAGRAGRHPRVVVRLVGRLGLLRKGPDAKAGQQTPPPRRPFGRTALHTAHDRTVRGGASSKAPETPAVTGV